MEKDYVHTMLSDRVPVPVGFTGNNYSSLVGYERTNSIYDIYFKNHIYKGFVH